MNSKCIADKNNNYLFKLCKVYQMSNAIKTINAL